MWDGIAHNQREPKMLKNDEKFMEKAESPARGAQSERNAERGAAVFRDKDAEKGIRNATVNRVMFEDNAKQGRRQKAII